MTTPAALLHWTPRLLGVLVALFLSIFALDVFDGRTVLEIVPELLIHLAPAAIVLAIVIVAWRVPLAGAVAFPLLALAYAVSVRWRPDWVAVTGGPLVVVGLLFFASWRARDATGR
jgi:hypothetical protein